MRLKKFFQCLAGGFGAAFKVTSPKKADTIFPVLRFFEYVKG